MPKSKPVSEWAEKWGAELVNITEDERVKLFKELMRREDFFGECALLLFADYSPGKSDLLEHSKVFNDGYLTEDEILKMCKNLGKYIT